MIRLIVIALVVIGVWFLLLKLFQQARDSGFDWRGLAVAIGFVVLALYLGHATGMSLAGF